MQEMIIEYPYERVKFSAEVRSQGSFQSASKRPLVRLGGTVLMATAKSRLGTYVTCLEADRYVQEDMGDRHIPRYSLELTEILWQPSHRQYLVFKS